MKHIRPLGQFYYFIIFGLDIFHHLFCDSSQLAVDFYLGNYLKGEKSTLIFVATIAILFIYPHQGFKSE